MTATVTDVEVYYSITNRVAGYIILCLVPFATGTSMLFQQPGLPSAIYFAGFTLFGLMFFAKLSCKVRFDQFGIRGQWFLLPVKKSWSDITSIEPWDNRLGRGFRINYLSGQGFVRHMSFSISIEGYEALEKMLVERGFTIP